MQAHRWSHRHLYSLALFWDVLTWCFELEETGEVSTEGEQGWHESIIIWPGFLFRPHSTAVLSVWEKALDAKFVSQWWGGTNGYFPHQLMSSVCCGKQGVGYLLGASVVSQHEHKFYYTCWTWRTSLNHVTWLWWLRRSGRPGNVGLESHRFKSSSFPYVVLCCGCCPLLYLGLSYERMGHIFFYCLNYIKLSLLLGANLVSLGKLEGPVTGCFVSV